MTAGEILKAELVQVGASTFTSSRYKPGLVRHIVLFRYQKGVSSVQIVEITRRFKALESTATRDGTPYIVSIEAGAQSSGEGADGGFDEGFIVTFGSEGDRNYYVGSPVVTNPAHFDAEHQKFKDFVDPFLADDGVLVFDFAVAEKAN